MKVIGICMIVFCFTLAGFKTAAEPFHRVRLLEKALLLMQNVRRELLLTHAPSKRLLEQLGNRYHDPFLAECILQCKEASFPQAWRKTVGHVFSALNPQQRAPLLAVGAILGSGDLHHQEEALLQWEEEMKRMITQEKECCRTHGKLYSCLGVLMGLAVAVLLL